MKTEEFDTLKPGDSVRHIGSGNSYIILDKRPSPPTYYIAIRSITVSQPDEWEKIKDEIRTPY